MTSTANDPRPPESPEVRRKRLALRSWRRGIKEMDLILGRFADAELARLSSSEMDAYEALMEENDWDLYYWVTGARPAPGEHGVLIERIARFHEVR